MVTLLLACALGDSDDRDDDADRDDDESVGIYEEVVQCTDNEADELVVEFPSAAVWVAEQCHSGGCNPISGSRDPEGVTSFRCSGGAEHWISVRWVW